MNKFIFAKDAREDTPTDSHATKNPDLSGFFERCEPDLNRRMTVLQTGALPLGYRTTFMIYAHSWHVMHVKHHTYSMRAKMTPTGIEPVLPP